MPLAPNATAGDWIKDFINSDNPKFAGKSKKERQKMALAAYYAHSRNEEVEQIDELSTKTLKSYSKKSSHDAEKHINRFVKGGNEKSITHAEKRSKGINTAQQLLARKKTHIEETEMNENELLELRNKTLNSYIKKAKTSFSRASVRADKEEDKAMSTNGEKYPEKQARHEKNWKKEWKLMHKRSQGIDTAYDKLKHNSMKEETEMNENELNEGMTRKHFQMVADLIKGHKDPKKRSELAHHHAAIFKADNPRFDHDRFFKAANAERHPVKEDVGHEALFAAILDGNRDEANDIFDSVLSGRVDALVADKKQELATSLFNQPVEEENEEVLHLLGITEEFEPLELIAEETHGHHHQVYSELTDRNKRLADAAANTYARGDITKDHKREIMRHFNLADKSLETAKNKLGSAEAADHLNVAATHITDGGLHLQNVRAHTSLGYASY